MSDPVTHGLTVWLTGLPGSGKTTSASYLLDHLAANGVAAASLDGDVLRTGISADLGFSDEDRDENVRRAGEIALLLARQGAIVVVSLVSPRRAARDRVRARHDAAGVTFIEVHVAAPHRGMRGEGPEVALPPGERRFCPPHDRHRWCLRAAPRTRTRLAYRHGVSRGHGPRAHTRGAGPTR